MMKKAVMKFMACCLAAAMTFAGSGTVALADQTNTLAGLSTMGGAAAETEAALETIEGTQVGAQTESAETEDTENTDTEAADTEAAAAAETATIDTSMSGELAFAQCEEYINVRTGADTDSEVVGKVYNNGSVTILSQVGDWYEVQSGNVTGYVKAEYFATGEEADAIAEEVAYNVATVYPEALVIRSDASEDSEQIGMAYSSDQLEVVAYEGDWMKVALGNDVYGYVSAYYVGYDTYYATAETLEEEQQRLDEQWLQYLADQKAEEEAAAAAAAESYEETWTDDSAYTDDTYYEDTTWTEDTSGTDDTYYEDTTWTEDTYYEDTTWTEDTYYEDTTWTEDTSDTYTETPAYTGTDLSAAQAAADAAYQAYLDAQAAADAATQGMDEQAVYDTAAQAQAAYQAYLSAQQVVDQLLAGLPAETEAETWETEAAQTWETEAPQTESWETEAPQTESWETEAPQTEAPQTEAPETEAPAYSSTGQAIADFAVQFVGNPYVWGGTSLTNGADCSGFTQSVFANFGISIPRTAAAQSGSGTPVDLSAIQPGDLLFYSDGSGIGHVTLYIGNGQVVHASTSSTGIIISSYNYRTPVSARRYY